MLKAKKGAELTIGTIVIIVLALIVLVVLIVGFTGGWGNLWSRITEFSGESNVDEIILACKVACQKESVYEYCKVAREVVWEENGRLKKRDYSCFGFAKDIERFGYGGCEKFKSCPEATVIGD